MKKPIKITLEGKTKAEQKVIIAQDVIGQIVANILKPKQGSYVVATIKKSSKVQKSAGVKENYEALSKCEVCGVGACLMSITKFKNKLHFNDLPESADEFNQDSLDLLKSVFSPTELALIEIAFEKTNSNWAANVGKDRMGIKISYEQAFKAVEFGKKYRSASKRLIAIMQNIIDNKGKLKF